MWLGLINEVSEKGTGSKLVLRTSSLNREKNSLLLLMLCYQDEKIILFVDTCILIIFFLDNEWNLLGEVTG